MVKEGAYEIDSHTGWTPVVDGAEKYKETTT